ncbi:Nn.00g056390.m01.CDS01 [Neocucurbitaria sp. VM-36]
MDGRLHLHSGLADPSIRPNLYHTRSGTRIVTNPDLNKKSHLHKHKSHRHHHHEHHDRHSSSKRHAAKEAVQSALQIEPPTSFGDLLRQTRGSKDTSPSHSRKGSVATGHLDGIANAKKDSDETFMIPPRRPLRAEDVEKEGKRVEARERDLRTTLQSLSDQSLKTSRRLDDTYYSILEKLSVLRQTIGSLQELSGLTKELHDNFESDTKDLIEHVEGQFEGFNDFKTQQEQVNGLEERIRVGREKADTLTARLAKAKERVDTRAKIEAEWEVKNTRRLRFFWGILSTIVALILAVILFHQFKPIHVSKDHRSGLDFASRAKIMDAPIPDIAKEAIMGSLTNIANPTIETSVAKPLLEDDERLRRFDEL